LSQSRTEACAGIGRHMNEVSTTSADTGQSLTPAPQAKSLRWVKGTTVEFVLIDTSPLLSKPFDPFHRTASERRLCGDLVDLIAVESEDSALQPGAWPPRASAALALEAFGRILDEREHLRQPADDDCAKGFIFSSPTEQMEQTGAKDERAEHSDCLCPHDKSTQDQLPCEPSCDVSAMSQECFDAPQDSCMADDTDGTPEADFYSFLHGWFWGTAPADKCTEPILPNDDQRPAPVDSTSPVQWTSSLAWDRPAHIQGAILISGGIEERPGAICQALRQGLSDVIGQLSPTKITVSCEWARVESEITDNGIQIRCHEFSGNSREMLVIEPDSHIKFDFTAHLSDPLDNLAALDALRLESACAGAWRFLPAIVDCLGQVRRLSVRLEVGLAEDVQQTA